MGKQKIHIFFFATSSPFWKKKERNFYMVDKNLRALTFIFFIFFFCNCSSTFELTTTHARAGGFCARPWVTR